MQLDHKNKLLPLLFLLMTVCCTSFAAQVEVTTLLDDDDQTNDAEQCTLREAVLFINLGGEDVPDGCTLEGDIGDSAAANLIFFDEDLFDPESGSQETLILSGEEIVINTRPMTIKGPGSELLKIDADDKRIFNCTREFSDTGQDVNLVGMTLTDAGSPADAETIPDKQGVVVRCAGDLFLEDVVVTNNNDFGVDASLIWVMNANLSLLDTVIENNVVGGAIGALHFAVGVRNGNAFLTRSRIVNNSFDEGSSALGLGGLAVDGGTLTMNESEITSNKGPGIYVIDGNAEINASEISNNESDFDAGGISVFEGNLEVTNSLVSGNTSRDFGEGSGPGGIQVISGDLTLLNSTVSGNASSTFGGGMSVFGGDVEINRSTVANNTVQNPDGFDEPVFAGGLYLGGGNLSVFNSTFSGNRVLGSDAVGGGIYHQSNEERIIDILHATFANNFAATAGGALAVESDEAAPAIVQIVNSLLAQEDSSFDLCQFLAGDTTFSAVGVSNMATDDSCSDNSSPFFLAGAGENGITAFADLKLAALADNNGATQTHALEFGSAAIDAASLSDCGSPLPFADQRGVPRPEDGDGNGGADCDIGSYEASEIAYDYGDAPDSYGTTIVSDGPRHITTGVQLGTLRDSEVSGQPTVDADGDDIAGTDDEDALATAVTVQAGTTLTLEYTVTTNGSNNPVLNAWLDINQDGDFDDAGEQVATDMAVIQGVNEVTVDIPSVATAGTYYGRVRVCSDATTCSTPGGTATDGEVEDYTVSVTAAEVEEDEENNNNNNGGGGGGGGGCTLQASGKANFDPTLILLAALAWWMLLSRLAARRKREST